jgi:hypothetical protein
MRPASGTDDLGPDHIIGFIGFVDDTVLSDGFIETRPPAGTRKFGIGPEQGVSADGTEIGTLRFIAEVFPRKSLLRRLLAGHCIQVRREYLLPNGIADVQCSGIRSRIIGIVLVRIVRCKVLRLSGGYRKQQDEDGRYRSHIYGLSLSLKTFLNFSISG